MNTVVLYCGVRMDLSSMGRGKALAQACHVGSLFSEHHIVRPLDNRTKIDPLVQEWRDSENTPDAPLGFGVTLTIDLPDLVTMTALVETASMLDFKAGLLVDPSYPFIIANELVSRLDSSKFTLPPQRVSATETVCFVEETTMCYILGRKADLAILLGRYKLVPND